MTDFIQCKNILFKISILKTSLLKINEHYLKYNIQKRKKNYVFKTILVFIIVFQCNIVLNIYNYFPQKKARTIHRGANYVKNVFCGQL